MWLSKAARGTEIAGISPLFRQRLSFLGLQTTIRETTRKDDLGMLFQIASHPVICEHAWSRYSSRDLAVLATGSVDRLTI